MRRRIWLLTTSFLWTALSLFGQVQIQPCAPGQLPPGATTCADACVQCGNIDGITTNNDNDVLAQVPDGFCAPQLHNVQWFGFVAGSSNITLEIAPFNCQTGAGLQIAVYSTQDCNSFAQVSNCEPSGVTPGNPGILNIGGVTPGTVLYLVVDGNGFDICDFTVNVLDGSTGAGPITDDTDIQPDLDNICTGGSQTFSATTVDNAGIYEWTLNGNFIGSGNSQTIDFPVDGTYEICVTPTNACFDGNQVCETVTVGPLPPEILDENICEGESFTYQGNTFNSGGFYTFSYTDGAGCIQDVELTITEIPTIEVDRVENVCPGEFVEVDGIPYGPGIYDITLTASTGCDSIINLNVIGNPAPTEVFNEEICEGQFVIYGGQLLDSTGLYQFDLTTNRGCDSTVIVTLDVFSPSTVTIDSTICRGEIYDLGGAFYDQSGTYTANLIGAGGCDSAVTLFLTVDSPATTIDTVVCEGESVTIAGVPYDATGTYTETTPAANGCDSIITLNLTVLGTVDSTFVETICEGESLNFNGQTYDSTGVYIDTLTSAIGCDSLVILDLTELPVPVTDLQEEICQGDSVVVGGNAYSMPGTYQEILTAANGCDSIVNLDLQVLNVITENISGTICDGDSFPVGNLQADTMGIWTDTLVSSLGCDSIIILDLTVLPIPITDLNVSICDGDSFVDGAVGPYSATGQYSDTLTAASGCDSIVNLDLTVVPDEDTTLNIQICTGLTYTVGSSVYDSTGTYVDTLQTQVLGCDSVVTLNLTVRDVLTDTLVTSVCEGDLPFTVDGNDYTATGIYDLSYLTNQGCDSVFTLDLTVVNNDTTNLVESICDGEVFTVAGNDFNADGIYEVVLTDQTTGCDSVVNLDLTVLNVPETNLTESICDGESFVMAGNPYTTTGTYSDTLTAANGCDSIINLDLTVLNVPVTDLTGTICDGEAFVIAGNPYTTTGTYSDTLTAANGCDSIINLDLTVLNVPVTDLTVAICSDTTYTVGSSTYDMTGLYSDTLAAANGCDSIINLDLTVHPVETTDLDVGICTGSSYQVDTFTFTTAGSYTVVLTTVNGCDSIINLDLDVTDFIETNLVESICEGDAFTVGDSTYTQAGTYQNDFIAIDGCDSIVNLDLSVIPIAVTDLTESICEGDTFTVGTSNYATSGLYTDTLMAMSTGCDSVVNLDLTVIQPLVTDLTESICDGEVFVVGDSSYTASGTYQNTFTAQSTGCDSIVNLDLTVIAIPQTDLVQTICEGDTVQVGNTPYTTTGNYSETLTGASGCDSVVTLDLTVIPTAVTDLTETICEGDSITVGTSVYNQSGQYTDILIAASTGCDSVVNLDLTVIPTVTTTLNEAICADETFTVGTQVFDTAGTYTVPLTAQTTGCDSIVTLNLTVNPIDTTDLEAAICEGESFDIGSDSYDQTGSYTSVLSASTGCDSIVNLDLVVYPCNLQFDLATVDIRCGGESNGQIAFSMLVGTPPYTYTWQQLGGALQGSGTLPGNGETARIDSLPAGSYQILVTDSFDVTQVIDAELTEPEPVVVTTDASDYGTFNLSCFGASDGFLTASASGGSGGFTYAWSTGASGPGVENLPAGTYTVTATDQNGCQDSTTAVLVEPQPVLGSLELADPPCAGDESGAIVVESVEGGTSPYLYTIDGGIFTNEPIFTNLPAGEYTVAVEDVNGCRYEEEVTLQEPDPFVASFNYNDTLSIELGDSVEIRVLSDESGRVETIQWEPSDLVDCDSCLSNMVDPDFTTTYFLTLIDSSGCVARDALTVIVDRRQYVYIPNAFSPNGDGNNDFHTVFADPTKVARILEYQIFDRWGEIMISLNNPFPPNSRDPAHGWDGTHRGKPMNAGVYVYHLTVEYFDGRTEFFKGDVVLMR